MPLKNNVIQRQCCLLYHSSKPLLLPSRLRFGWSRLPCRKSSCEGFDFVPDGLLQILSNGLVLTSGTVTLDLGVRVVKYESQSVSFCCSPSAPPTCPTCLLLRRRQTGWTLMADLHPPSTQRRANTFSGSQSWESFSLAIALLQNKFWFNMQNHSGEGIIPPPPNRTHIH